MTIKISITTTLIAIGMFTTFTVFLANADDGLNYDPNNVTVSGLSSGGYMATQMHIAHSDSIHGVRIIVRKGVLEQHSRAVSRKPTVRLI